MTAKPFHRILPGLLLLPAITAFAGGWAAISVRDLPDHAVAGQPVTLTFSVLQHGVHPVGGLNARVEATSAGRAATAKATPGSKEGEYTATLTLPQPGEWTITIHSGFGNSRVKLVPLTVIAPGTRPATLAAGEQGRRLFVAKGCITCHVHADAEGTQSLSVGPDLTGRRFAAEYLAQFLANPAMKPSASGNRMPNLNLKVPEIAALVAFINGGAQAGAE